MPRKVIDATKPLVADGSPGGPRALVFESGDPRDTTTRVSRIEIPGGAGTHILAPYFLDLNGPTLSDLDVKTFFGEGMAVRFRFGGPNALIGKAEMEAGASNLLRRGDIVILCNLGAPENAPTFSSEAAQWLVEKGTKLVGFDEKFNIDVAGAFETHRVLLAAGVPIVCNLVNLHECSGGRLAAMALPLAMTGLASSPARVLLLD